MISNEPLKEILGVLVATVQYQYPVWYGLVMSYVSRVSALLVRKRENPEGLERGIDLADPLNLLKIHLVVFFGYSTKESDCQRGNLSLFFAGQD